MAIDLKGAIKDNQKLLLSIIAVVALIIIIPISDRAGWLDLNIDNSGNVISPEDTNTDSEPMAVNNGNANKYSAPPAYSLRSGVDYQADIVTSKGTFRIDLYERDTPKTVNNFVFLAKNGFYDQSSFHRIISNFVIQGGDPLGNGTGGPGYTFEDEIVSYLTFAPYMVAMANSGADTNGSQFFVTTRLSNTSSLNGGYTIFGKVVDGYQVVDAIEAVEVKLEDPNKNMPFEPVYIQTINIVEK